MRTKLLIVAAVLVAAVSGSSAASAEPHGNTPAPAAAPAESGAPAEAVLTGITQVNAGYYLTCARTNTGQARCWGHNDVGQLGNGNVNPHQFAVTVRNTNNTGPLTGVVQVAAGDDHACALLTNRQVRCWGENGDGQVGNGTDGNTYALPIPVRNAGNTGVLTNVIQISAESDGTCALLSNHQLRCWGDNDYGQLGNGHDGDAFDSNLPVTVKAVSGVGALTNVASVESGYDTNCALLTNHQVRCWGYNEEGQLGNDDSGVSAENLPQVVQNVPGTGPLTTVTQIAAAGYVMCARLANGQARCWGYNEYGEVGDGTFDQRERPVAVSNAGGTGPLVNVAAVTTGYGHACALLTNHEVRCWGETYYGEVGDGTAIAQSTPYIYRTRPRSVKNLTGAGNLTNVVQIHANQYHTCALINTGQVRCWGYNGEGQLGNGGTVDKPLPVKVQV